MRRHFTNPSCRTSGRIAFPRPPGENPGTMQYGIPRGRIGLLNRPENLEGKIQIVWIRAQIVSGLLLGIALVAPQPTSSAGPALASTPLPESGGPCDHDRALPAPEGGDVSWRPGSSSGLWGDVGLPRRRLDGPSRGGGPEHPARLLHRGLPRPDPALVLGRGALSDDQGRDDAGGAGEAPLHSGRDRPPRPNPAALHWDARIPLPSWSGLRSGR